MNILLRIHLPMIKSTLHPVAKLRLGWFVLIAALRDWRLPDQSDG